MAQAAGIMMLRHVSSEDKLAYFMSADKVKSAKLSSPETKCKSTLKSQNRAGRNLFAPKELAKVDGKVASSAELMFAIIDASEAP